jgi:hypothetical protein
LVEVEAAGNESETPRNGGGLVSAIVERVAKVWNAVFEDGYLAAAGRQGAMELGVALKAFPDSISADEPGTLWNPTQGEIAADRKNSDMERSPWPSEIAQANRHLPSNDHGNENAKDSGFSM